MKMFLNILGFLWCLPVSILVWIFMAILCLCGQVDSFCILWRKMVFIWDIEPDSKFYQLGKRWFGWTAGNNVVLYKDTNFPKYTENFRHELAHSRQHFKWGIFFFPAYIIESVWLWLFRRNKHAYFVNHFERDARVAAGQPTHIPRNQWPDGPNDRWPWW